ncbi:MAG: hypothetical protein ACI8P9_004814 [Parasphingorhabdus sp.]|jgi:hypothetical protein
MYRHQSLNSFRTGSSAADVLPGVPATAINLDIIHSLCLENSARPLVSIDLTRRNPFHSGVILLN